MPDISKEELPRHVDVPGLGTIDLVHLWDIVGPRVLGVPGQDAPEALKEILKAGILTWEEITLLMLVGLEALTGTKFEEENPE